MECGSGTASDDEIKESYNYILDALETEVEQGFKAGFFEVGDIKYSTVILRADDNMRLLKLQAGNKNVSFGMYETRDKIRSLADGL